MQSKRFFYTDEEKGFLKLNERKLMTPCVKTHQNKKFGIYLLLYCLLCVCNVHTFAAYSNWSSICNRS